MDIKKKGGDDMLTTREKEDAIDSFVAREVFVNQSMLIEEGFKKELFCIDDIQNYYKPFDGKINTLSICLECKDSSDLLDIETGECETCFGENQEPQEIFEWWLVSPWLGRKLLLAGEPVIEICYGSWWGRTTMGQAISMDYVIQQIFNRLIG